MHKPTGESKQERLRLAQDHAIAKGGQCLSKEYVGTREKLLWKCGNPNHKQWAARYDMVVRGKQSWCPECGFEKVHNILMVPHVCFRGK